MPASKKKNLRAFIAEEDGKTIKKSLLIASLGLVTGLGLAETASAGHSNNHSSTMASSAHSSCHGNHNNHSSY